MANETFITATGNIVADPELRFTPSGIAVADFTIASTPRRYDKNANKFVDQETLFMRVSAWRELGENCAETLKKGMHAIVYGTLTQRSFETRDGDKRTVIEMTAENVGPSLRFATADIHRADATHTPRTPRRAPETETDPWRTTRQTPDDSAPF